MLTMEYEQEIDGRWICEVVELPGVMVYGDTLLDADKRGRAMALIVLADRLEHGESIPVDLDVLFS